MKVFLGLLLGYSTILILTYQSPTTPWCFYEISLKIPNHHSMKCCSYPRLYEHEMFMEKWRDKNWPIIIRYYCFYLVFSFVFAGCVAFAICKNLRLSTTMKLLMLLSILVLLLSQPILNNWPFPTCTYKRVWIPDTSSIQNIVFSALSYKTSIIICIKNTYWIFLR